MQPDEDDDGILEGIGKAAKDALIAGFAELFAWLDAMPDHALPGLDGRSVFGRKRRARVNTLIQSSGAIVSKRWIVPTDQALHDAGLRWDTDFQIVAWIHDELQIARRPELAEQVAAILSDPRSRPASTTTSIARSPPTAESARPGRKFISI